MPIYLKSPIPPPRTHLFGLRVENIIPEIKFNTTRYRDSITIVLAQKFEILYLLAYSKQISSNLFVLQENRSLASMVQAE